MSQGNYRGVNAREGLGSTGEVGEGIQGGARRELVVVSVHNTLGISGVTVAGARLANENLPGITWIPMVVGEESELTEERMNSSALAAVETQCVVTWPKGASPLQQVMAVREALRVVGADVVVGHDAPVAYVACALEEATWGGGRGGLRSLLWHHSSGYDGDDVLLRCGGLAHAWCAVSKGLTEHARRILGQVRDDAECVESAPVMVEVLPRPAEWVPNTRTLRMVYSGRLANRHKRIMDLVKLADGLVARGVRFHLTIAGDGPAGKMLREACKPHLKAGRIALVGAVMPDRAIDLYGAHDLGILVSESEGMPLSVAECMSQGRLVAITTGCGGATELVRDGENGIVVPTGDMEKMADRLAELSAKRERIKAMGGNARETVAARLTIGALRETYVKMVCAAHEAPARMVGDGGGAGDAGGWWKQVRNAMDFIGTSTPEDMEKLRNEFLGLQHKSVKGEGGQRVFGGESDGVVPLSAERLLREAVQACVQGGAKRIMLYGAGAHAKKVARVIGESKEIVGVVDDAAEKRGQAEEGQGNELAGKPIMSPFEAGRVKFDAVILCSDEFEEVLGSRAKVWCGEVPVVSLYGRWGQEREKVGEVSSRAA